jgi:hypothetical protein
MFDEGYKRRLAEWVEQEWREAGSYNKLSQKISRQINDDSFPAQLLQRWHAQKIKDELKGKTLEKLALYRGMTVEQVRAWLEGREVGQPLNPKQVEALNYIQTAPLKDVARLVHVGSERLIDYWEKSMVRQQTPIAAFIQMFLDREVVSVMEFELTIQQRSNLGVGALREIMASQRNPTDQELFEMGTVLRNRDNLPYDFEYLQAVRDGKKLHDSGDHENGDCANSH